MGTDASYPPYDFKDEKGNAQGFDVDIIKAIAENQGFNVDVIPQSWDALIKGLDNDQNHLVLSGFYKSEERMAKYAVSETYMWGKDAIGVRGDNTTIADIRDLSGKKVSTLMNSPYVEELEMVMGKGSSNIIQRPSDFLVFKELAQGGVDAVMGEEGVLRYYAKQFPDVDFKIVGDFEPYEMAIIAPKAEVELMDKVNAGLANIVADGTYAKIYEKWFGGTPEKLPVAKANSQ